MEKEERGIKTEKSSGDLKHKNTMAYDKYVSNRIGSLLEGGSRAEVDGYTFYLKDLVPYRNSRSNIRYANIESFKIVDNGSVWFNGVDEKTKAKVYYGLHCSLSLQREIDDKK